MNARRYLPIGLLLIAIAAVWIAVRGGEAPGAPTPSDDAALMEMPSGERLTLQFFRNAAPVASLTLETLDGQRLSSADWRGKVTILNFWATWCGPCRAEIPDLVALQKKYRKYVQVVGISKDEAPPEVVGRFAAEYKVNYPIVMSTPELSQAFPGINALPTSYILDRESRVVQKHVGLLKAWRTEQETRALAGLPVNAVIEEIDPIQRVRLDEWAEVTEIPGIDLSSIPAARRIEVLRKMNDDDCTCGCQLSVAKCRIDDPTCDVSLPLARTIIETISAAK